VREPVVLATIRDELDGSPRLVALPWALWLFLMGMLRSLVDRLALRRCLALEAHRPHLMLGTAGPLPYWERYRPIPREEAAAGRAYWRDRTIWLIESRSPEAHLRELREILTSRDLTDVPLRRLTPGPRPLDLSEARWWPPPLASPQLA
jgi:hypothetical protein